jgi:beta-galactosidase
MKNTVLTLFLLMCIANINAQRKEINFNNNWNFILEDNPSFSKKMQIFLIGKT